MTRGQRIEVHCEGTSRMIRPQRIPGRAEIPKNGRNFLGFQDVVARTEFDYFATAHRPARVKGRILCNSVLTDPHVFTVRCQRRKHKIIIWPSGAVTLKAHSSRKAKTAALTCEALGQDVRCLHILRSWRNACSGNRSARIELPAALRTLSDEANKLRHARQWMQRGHRYQSEEEKAGHWKNQPRPDHPEVVDHFLRRSSEFRKQVIENRFETLFRDHWETRESKDAAREIRHGFTYGNMIRSTIGKDVWSKEMIRSGLLMSDLRIPKDQVTVFPLVLVPLAILPMAMTRLLHPNDYGPQRTLLVYAKGNDDHFYYTVCRTVGEFAKHKRAPKWSVVRVFRDDPLAQDDWKSLKHVCDSSC